MFRESFMFLLCNQACQTRRPGARARQPRSLGQSSYVYRRLITCWQSAELNAQQRLVLAEMVVPAHY